MHLVERNQRRHTTNSPVHTHLQHRACSELTFDLVVTQIPQQTPTTQKDGDEGSVGGDMEKRPWLRP